MSNLKLPKMDYYHLREMANDPERKLTADGWIKIAYQTFIRRDGAHVLVKHHDTVIADISTTYVYLYHGGFHSPTTSNRLNRILWENCGINVGLRNRALEVRYRDGSKSVPLRDGDMFYTRT